MNSKIEKAAASLLKKGKITQEEFNLLKKARIGRNLPLPRLKAGLEFRKSVPIISEAIPKQVLPWLQGGAYGLFGAALLKQLLNPVSEKIKAHQSYNQLIKKNPILAEKDPQEIKDYFNVIQTFSPKAASNPLVAGALINKMMEFGGVDHKLVQDLASIQSGLKSTDAMSHLTGAAARSLMTTGVMETGGNIGFG